MKWLGYPTKTDLAASVMATHKYIINLNIKMSEKN